MKQGAVVYVLSALCVQAGIFFTLLTLPSLADVLVGSPDAVPSGQVALSNPEVIPAKTVTLGNRADVPTGSVPVSQANRAGGGIQTRNFYADLSSWRGITQTFQWISDDYLDGIGLCFSSDQPEWTSDQQYVLVIQEIVPATGLPTSTVSEVEFTLSYELVNSNQWLFIDIDNLGLMSGQWYGFTLCPAADSVDGTQRIYWATADSGNFYAGRGAQFNPAISGLPKTDAYGSASTDMAFYLQSSCADPVSAVLQGNSAGGAIQSRNFYANLSSWRGITQTFQWNTEDYFDGLGLYFSGDQPEWTSDQQYVLVVQEIVPSTGMPTATVFEVEFSLSHELVASNQWLYIDINDQDLIDGQWYGFTLCPASNSVNGTQRVYWATAESGNLYSGRGAQFDPSVSGLPKTDAYGSASTDLTFYLKAGRAASAAAVVQSNAGGGSVQTRNFYVNLSDWRGVAQTFQWPTEQLLDGIGLRLASNQSAWSSDQQYVLVIQEISSGTNLPTGTVAEIEFTLPHELVVSNQWLFIDIDNLSLESGRWYGFTLCPADDSVNGTQRAYWATSDDGNGDGRRGSQFNPSVSGVPKTDAYGNNLYRDLTFYLQSCDLPSTWIPVGNEKEKVVDSQSGRTIRYLTQGDFIDTHFHYHNISWGEIGGRDYLFFSSSRNRPAEAGETVNGERQIMAADVETGDLYYLTTIMNDGGSVSHLTTRPYFATYNDATQTIFFFDKKRTNIYAYNCLTGEQNHLLSLPAGAVSREMDDFADDQVIRLMWAYSLSGQDYIALADFDHDLSLTASATLRQSGTNEALNHVGISPADKNMFFYKHHHDRQPDGSYATEDLCLVNLNSPQDTTIVNSQGEKVDHMVWGKSGDLIYWDDNQGHICCHAVGVSGISIIGSFGSIHNQLSSDENRWVCDTRSIPIATNMVGNVSTVNWNGKIKIYDFDTEQLTVYADIIWGEPHPRHPHAVFSPDDSMISFVAGAAVSNGNTRVAVMQVDEE